MVMVVMMIVNSDISIIKMDAYLWFGGMSCGGNVAVLVLGLTYLDKADSLDFKRQHSIVRRNGTSIKSFVGY